MGLQHEPQLDVARGGGVQEPSDVTLGIDEHAPALVGEQVTLVSQVGRPE
ncbi:hypothetical protein [Nonomuraea sp. PA05]|nr:hypothetical protein [Nonomuraea sp. PA05]